MCGRPEKHEASAIVGYCQDQAGGSGFRCGGEGNSCIIADNWDVAMAVYTIGQAETKCCCCICTCAMLRTLIPVFVKNTRERPAGVPEIEFAHERWSCVLFCKVRCSRLFD